MPLSHPGDPINPKSVNTKALRVDGVAICPDLIAKGMHIGDGGVLPDASEGQVLVFRGGRWATEPPPAAPAAAPAAVPPAWNAADWAGRPPADLPEAMLRLAHRLAASHGPIP